MYKNQVNGVEFMSDYENSLFEVEPTLVDNIFDIAFPDSIKK